VRQPSAQTGAENDRQNKIFAEILERQKLGALKTTSKLEVLISEMQLDEDFSEAQAAPALELARKLSAQLLTLHCLRLIVCIRAGICS
jgi:hypothetical protein